MIALVTGGSRGIGRAIVEVLTETGWDVVFTYRSDETLAHAIEKNSNGKARAFHLDLADRERPHAIVDVVENEHGPIEALINNAGIRREALLAMTPDAQWDEVMDVNVGGPFRFCRAALPKMISRRRGSIVNVSSLAAIAGVAGQTAYSAAKAALLGMTRSLAREAGRRGIRVNAVLPGFVETDMTSGLTEDVLKTLREKECLARGTTTRDVANAVAFLASDNAASITGQTLIVDAGTSA